MIIEQRDAVRQTPEVGHPTALLRKGAVEVSLRCSPYLRWFIQILL